jgi:cell division protein FtsN
MMHRAHTTLLPALALSGTLILSPVRGLAVTTTGSYATIILQNVREDKVYLLENIRSNVTKPSEKMVVEALLTEDGPRAAGLYRKQLAEFPDPQLDAVSRSRLAAFERAAGATARPPLNASKTARPTVAQAPAIPAARPDTVVRKNALPTPVLPPATMPARRPDSSASVAKPAPAPIAARPAAPPATPAAAPAGNFTLQFGSFDSATNAEQLAAQLPQDSPAGVVKVGQVFKVRLKRSFETREEAAAFARNLPIESFIITLRP